MQAETALRYWKAQHALVEKKLASVRTATAYQQGIVPTTQAVDGVHASTTGASPQQLLERDGDAGVSDSEPMPTRTPRILAPPSPASPELKTSPPRTSTYNFDGGGGGKSVDGNAVDGIVAGVPGVAAALPCQKVPPLANTDASEAAMTSPSQLTFLERRAVFCSNDSSTTLPVPVPSSFSFGTEAVASPLPVRHAASRTSPGTLPISCKPPPEAVPQTLDGESAAKRRPAGKSPAKAAKIPPFTSSTNLGRATRTDECEEKREPQIEEGGGVARVSPALSTVPVVQPAQPAHTASASASMLPSIFYPATTSDDHAAAPRFTSFCSPSSASCSLRSPATSSTPSTAPRFPSPPTPSPAGTDSPPPTLTPIGIDSGGSPWVPGAGNNIPGVTTVSPSIASPPPLSRPNVDDRKKAAASWAALSSPGVAGEEPSKRDSNVWYGVWEGKSLSDKPQPGEGPESADSENVNCREGPGLGRVSWGGDLDGAGNRRTSWVAAKGSGGGDGGIVASLAMASPMNSVQGGSRSPPLSPEFARPLSSSSNAAPALLKDCATVPSPPSASCRSGSLSSWSGIALRQKAELRRSISSSPGQGVGERLRKNRHPHGFTVQTASPAGPSPDGPSPASAANAFASPFASLVTEEKESGEGGEGGGAHGGSGGGGADGDGHGGGGRGVSGRGSARPRGILVSRSRNQRSGDADAWQERPLGVGPWPLFEPASRESIVRSTRDCGQGFRKTSQEKEGKTSSEHEARLLTARAARAKGGSPSQPHVSIENVTPAQSSRLWAVRERLERRYSWARGVSSTNVNGTVPQEGFSEHQQGRGEGQGRDYSGHRNNVTKPWGSGQGLMVSRKVLAQRAQSERFQLGVPPDWEVLK